MNAGDLGKSCVVTFCLNFKDLTNYLFFKAVVFLTSYYRQYTVITSLFMPSCLISSFLILWFLSFHFFAYSSSVVIFLISALFCWSFYLYFFLFHLRVWFSPCSLPSYFAFLFFSLHIFLFPSSFCVPPSLYWSSLTSSMSSFSSFSSSIGLLTPPLLALRSLLLSDFSQCRPAVALTCSWGRRRHTRRWFPE